MSDDLNIERRQLLYLEGLVHLALRGADSAYTEASDMNMDHEILDGLEQSYTALSKLML